MKSIYVLMLVGGAVQIPGASAAQLQQRAVVRHVVRATDTLTVMGRTWEEVARWSVLSQPPREATALRLAFGEVGLVSIVPGGNQIRSCQQYALVLEEPRLEPQRVVFVLGSVQEPSDVRFRRWGDSSTVQLLFRARDCLTYEDHAANRRPTTREYMLDVTLDSVRVHVIPAAADGLPSNARLERPGALGGLGNEWLEGSMSRSLTRRFAWRALAPAAQAQGR